MNNREICRFVNSKDIRKHLMDINYSFLTVEAAWLVNQCYDATLNEKIDAWKDIIDTMPDQSVDSFHFDKPYESIHKVIRDYIALKKKALEMFFTESAIGFYQYVLKYSNCEDSYDYSFIYSSYDKCLKQLKKELSDEDADDILYGCIRRSEIDCFYSITANYNRDGEIKDVIIPSDYGVLDWNLLDFFNEIWLNFPVPYEPGDILYDPFHHSRGLCSGPIVMTGITPIQYEKDGKDRADVSDMNVWGYFQDEESGTLYQETTWNYMDFEYYPKQRLVNKRRILKALSNFLKDEIDLELFIKAYHLIIIEETKNDLMPRGWFTDEGMELAGLS